MTLVVSGIKLALDYYLGWRITRALHFLNPSADSWPGWVVFAFFFLFYLLPLTGLIQYLISSNVNIFEYPKAMAYLFWGGVAFSFQLLTWIILFDLFKLLANYGFGINAPFVDQGFGVLVMGFSIVILIYTGFKMYRDTTRIETEKIKVEIERLPEELEGFKIVHISDIQADQYTNEQKVSRYVDRINEQQPDLVIFTGDLISYGTLFVDMAAHQLGRIKATHGVYGVIGDHDYWAGAGNIIEALNEHDITILNGENQKIQIDSARIKLTGITHVYSRNTSRSEMEALTRDSANVKIKILASHQVSEMMVDLAHEAGYRLVLGGHTHGGQVRVPVFFKKIAASNFETRYIHGQYRENGMLININNGLGFTLAPVRYNAPSNVSVLELIGK